MTLIFTSVFLRNIKTNFIYYWLCYLWPYLWAMSLSSLVRTLASEVIPATLQAISLEKKTRQLLISREDVCQEYFTSFIVIFVVVFRLFFFFFLSRAAPTAYGGYQAKGQIRAVAASLHPSHSSARFKFICNLHHILWRRQILNPLIKVKDQTHVLMDTSQVC